MYRVLKKIFLNILRIFIYLNTLTYLDKILQSTIVQKLFDIYDIHNNIIYFSNK